MNIFYISSSSFPSRRANAVHVTSMCRALNNLGHYVYLFVKSEGNNIKNFIINNYEIKSSLTQIIETKTFFRRGTEFFIAITALIKYLSLKRSQKKSYVIISRNLFAAYFLSIMHDKKIIYETHTKEVGFIRELVQKILLKSNNVRVAVITNALKKILVSNFNLQNHNIDVYPDAAFDRGEPIKNQIKIIKREKFFSYYKKKIKNFDYFAGYFGHLYPGRGIEVIEQLAKKNYQILFFVFGGQEKDILKYKKKNELANLIFAGHLPFKDVQLVMSLMDVLLMPYQKSVSVSLKSVDTAAWMSPMKMFEYLSVGVPIISSNIPVLREILVDGENCLMVESDDISGWCQALKKILSKPELEEKLGSNSYRLYKGSHTWDRRARAMINLL